MSATLSVGMAVFQETCGAYFTIAGLRANHPHVEIIVVDNAPLPDERTRDACLAAGGRYVHKPNLYGTSAPRDEVFRLSQTPWTMCVDAHVIFETGAIESLIRYAEANPESNDIVSGPLVYDNGGISTHWRQTTPPGLWGVWDTDARGMNRSNPPFEVPMQGLGCFAMRTKAWPGFNPLFKGFGGEEGCIHEVVRRRGGKALCLPSLRWRHWFRDTIPHLRREPYRTSTPYVAAVDDHCWNLLVGHREVGIDARDAIFKDFGSRLQPGVFDSLVAKSEAAQPWDTPGERPAPLKVLGIWYSNNAAPVKVLNASLGSIKRAADLSRADVKVVTCPWERIAGNPFPEVLAEFKSGPGHLNIVRQQRQCMGYGYGVHSTLPPGHEFAGQSAPPDVVCFLEHDVMYPPDYFDRVARAFRENPAAPVVCNDDYEGLNGTGWLRVKELHQPLHQMAMRYDLAVSNLARCEAECLAQGWCYLEPQKPVIVRSTSNGPVAVDFDGTWTAGWIPPCEYVVITGRTPNEDPDVRRVLPESVPVHYRPDTPEYPANDHGVAKHKAEQIQRIGIVEFWEDNAVQVGLIRAACPGVVVNHVVDARSNWVRIPPSGKMPSIHINH